MSRRFHLFRHPWFLNVRFRTAEDDFTKQLGVGDTLVVRDKSSARPFLRIEYEGKDLTVTLLAPVLDNSLADVCRWADFAEEEQRRH